ncbi:MAG: DUF1566 domain-containing protein [Minicystis sp.]
MGWTRDSKLTAAVILGATIGAVALLGACNSVLGIGGFMFGECEREGDHRCTSNQLEVCSQHGAWTKVQDCEGHACDADAGACVGTCTPGKYRCAPESVHDLQSCSPEGQWKHETTCPNVCSIDRCGGECSPGTVTCSHGDNKPSDYGSTIMTCGDDGLWVPMPHPCVSGMPTDCEPSTSVCMSKTQTQMCGPDGKWLPTSDCPTLQECFFNTGACDVPCTSNERRCLGNGIQTCEKVGEILAWVDAGSCDEPCKPCNNGQCVLTPTAKCTANCVKHGVCDNAGTCVPDADGGKVECAFVPLDAGICNPTDCDPVAHTCNCNPATGTCSIPDTPANPPQGQSTCTTFDSCVTSSFCHEGACESSQSSEPPDHHWAHWKFQKNPPNPRYFTTGEVVYDQVTHLMWQRTPELMLFTNAQASTYCACLNNPPPQGTNCAPYHTHIIGYPQGWRLPTRIELASLVLYDQQGTTLINTTVFTAPPGLSFKFWSATVPPGTPEPPPDSASAWQVDFFTGLVSVVSAGTALPVRCVR